MLAFSIAVKTGQDLRGRGIDVEVLDGLRQEPLPRAIVKYVQYINERRAAMQAQAQGPAASAKAKGQAATVPGPEPEVTSEGDVHDDGPTIEGEDYDKNEPADQRLVKHVRIQSSPGHFPR